MHRIDRKRALCEERRSQSRLNQSNLLDSAHPIETLEARQRTKCNYGCN
jgi:hypothetical protein